MVAFVHAAHVAPFNGGVCENGRALTRTQPSAVRPNLDGPASPAHNSRPRNNRRGQAFQLR